MTLKKSSKFASEFFDLAVCVDAYHYFGIEENYLTDHLAPIVKKGCQRAVAVPGLKEEFTDGVPAELQPYWCDDMSLTLHSRDWWYNLWKSRFNKHSGVQRAKLS